jgi:hypothetical protein
MTWNFLNSALEKLSAELLLLALSALWLALRLLGSVVKKVENGKLVSVRLFGREFVRINGDSNSDPRPTEKNISVKKESKKNRTLQEKEKTPLADELDTLKTISPISFSPMEEQDSSQKNQSQVHESVVEGGIKW